MVYKEKLNAEYWNPTTDGKEIEGVFQGFGTKTIKEDGQDKIIKTISIDVIGRGIISLPSHNVLLSKLEDVEEGTQIKIIQLGEEKSKKNPKNRFMNYQVFVDE